MVTAVFAIFANAALAQVSFVPTEFPTPTPAHRIVTGDFNGDGNLDLVSAASFDDHSQDGFFILLGNGSGGFAAATLISALGAAPGDIIAADFNGDGKLDVAITRPTSTAFGFGNQVDVFLGHGDGRFGNPLRFSTGGSDVHLAVGDINNDGKPDLAVGSWDDQGVYVHTGNGDGTFGVGQFWPVPFAGCCNIGGIALTDLNGDGNLDLIVTSRSLNTVFVRLGNGVGSFGAATGFATGSLPGIIAAGDFNNDGKPDLALANAGSNNVSILPGTGTGGFGAATQFPTGSNPVGIAAADLDGDGNLDLVVSDLGSSDVSILLGTGTGAFRVPISLALASPPCCEIGIGDFNRDGQLDFAVGSNAVPTLSVFLNTTAPVDTTPPVILPQVFGTLGNNGWYRTSVTVTWSATDAESGIKSSSGCGQTVLTTDTAGVTMTCSATNGAGLSAAASVTIKIDQTPPVASATVTPPANANGWNNGTATVFFSGTDNLSGIDFCFAPIALASEGAGQTVAGTCTDKAGNVSAPATATVNIDKTPPVISGMPAAGCTLWPPNQQMVMVATVTAAHALSSLAPGSFTVTGSSNEPPSSTDPKNPDILITPTATGGFTIQLRADRLGSGNGRIYTLNGTAGDLAGNTATTTVTCTVPHDQGQ